MPDVNANVKAAIDEMFRDASLPRLKTEEELHCIVEYCEVLIDCLNTDDPADVGYSDDED